MNALEAAMQLSGPLNLNRHQLEQLQALLDRVVADEREACARIAEIADDGWPIAQRIRERTPGIA